jgi:hypothetical protein
MDRAVGISSKVAEGQQQQVPRTVLHAWPLHAYTIATGNSQYAARMFSTVLRGEVQPF